jgi:hypothetical protein
MAGAGTEWLEKSQCPRISCLFFKMAAWIIRRSGALQTT